MDIVYDDNNSNSVCFVGNYVHLRTFFAICQKKISIDYNALKTALQE